MEIESPLYETYPVTDIDLFLPTGDIRSFTLVDNKDGYEILVDNIYISFGDTEEVLVFFTHQLSGYSIRKRLHKRKIDPTTKPQVAAGQDSASPQSVPQPDKTDQPGPSDEPSSGQ